MAEAMQKSYADSAAYLLGSLPRHSRVSSRAITAAEKRLEHPAPAALRDYYLAVGKLDQLNDAHNHLLPPEEWFVDGGKLVFLAENQAVCYWGVGASKSRPDDPPVFQGVNNLPNPIKWHPEHRRC